MTSNGVYHLFVYGSLRSGFQSPAYEYISRFFELVGNAKAKGKMYDLGEYPAAKPTAEECSIVGELYRIRNEKEFDWAIGQLDDYEGVNAEYDEVQQYYRETAMVCYNNETIPAWIYWYSGDVTGKPVVESGDMLQYLKDKQ